MSTYKIISLLSFLYLIVGCTSDQADMLYRSNDEAAQSFYNSTLKQVIDDKCISCHIYHIEGNNRYDNYEKTKSNIVQMLSRLNSVSNTVMPPANAVQLTDEEKSSFQKFSDLLTSDNAVTVEPRIKVSWTAYKYPDFDNRAGVSGTFDDLNYELNENFTTPIDILKNATVTIDASSVNVGNEPERTGNVLRFFKAFTPNITGKINSYTKNSATIAFTMNGITQSLTFDVVVKEDKIVLTGKVPNMNSFKWKAGYDALEKVCGEYHQNKLWEDVAVSIDILLEK